MVSNAHYAALRAIMCFLVAALATACSTTQTSLDPSASMADFCHRLPRPEYRSLERRSDPDPWFEAYTVALGVTALYEPFQWQETISYLIEGSEQALLFDTGNGISDIHALTARLTNKPITVMNSHSHYDHVGGNYAFDRILAMNTSFTRLRMSGVPNEEIRVEVSADALCTEPPDGVTPDNHIGRPFNVAEFIEDGQLIDLGDRQLEVLHIPGHSPDAVALFERKTGLLWTGDTFYQGPIWLYAPETNLVQYRRSLQRLSDLVPELTALLPAHNTPLVDPQILYQVIAGFDLMLEGKAQREESFGDTVIYRVPGETRFSFLMRDEPLPYQARK